MSDIPQGQTARTVRVLEAFSSQKEWGIRELATALKISKGSTERTLQELVEASQLIVLEDGRYAGGPAMIRLAFSLVRSFDIVGIAWPHIKAVQEETGETTVLMLYDPVRVKCSAVSAAQSERAIRFMWESLQEWSDLHLGAGGKAILAALDASSQAEVLDALPDAKDAQDGWSKSRLKRDLSVIRKRGWSDSSAELHRGARGVAAPIRDGRGQLEGAVVIGWPDAPGESKRVKMLGERCKLAADSISADLGWERVAD